MTNVSSSSVRAPCRSQSSRRTGRHISLIGTLTGFTGILPTALLMIKRIRFQGLIVGHRRQQQDMVRAIDVLFKVYG